MGANSKGKVIKVYNPDIKSWVKLTDATSEDAVAPFIGSNGNWWIDNRDTGIPASGKSPIIGENGNWWIFDPALNEYADTGATAYGKTAYEYAVDHGYTGTEEDFGRMLNEVPNAVKDAKQAIKDSKEVLQNPPKIVDGNWYIYDYVNDTYQDSGINAVGDAFTIVKTYSSVQAMEDDYNNPEVKAMYLGNTKVWSKEQEDGVYIMLNDWSFVTVDQWKNANKPDNLGIAIIYGDKKLLLDYKNINQYSLRLYDFGTDMPIASSDTDALKDLNGFQNCTYAFANSPSFQEIAINLKLTTPSNEDLFPHVLSFGEAAILQRFGRDFYRALIAVDHVQYNSFWTSTRASFDEFWYIDLLERVNANTPEDILQNMLYYKGSQEKTVNFLPIFDLSNQ